MDRNPDGTSRADRQIPRGGAPVALRTRAVHAGEEPAAPVRPLVAPIHQSAVYAFAEPALADAWFAADPPRPIYARDDMPNARALERAVRDLEGAEAAHSAASGMAAIGLLFLACLAAGDHVVAAEDCYCDTAALLAEEMARFGVETSFVDPRDLTAVRAAMTPRTRILYVETISNPGMQLVDLPALAAIAHAGGALLCVDNTLATPVLCRPLEHGADVVIHSASKFLGGHHDLTAGVVAGQRDLIARVHRCGYLYGATLAPLDAWLALRGIRTLAPRIAWMTATAMAIAAYLESHPAIARVRYPGLPSHPQATLARRLLPDGAGAMLSIDFAGGATAADELVRRLRLIAFAPSFGGTSTTVAYLPAWNRGDGPYRSATLRMSVGLEAPRDLIADLAQALDGLLVPTATARNGAWEDHP